MIAAQIQEIRSRLPETVQLVAVSKFHTVGEMMEAYGAGQRLFGENRPQELAAKVPQMPSDVQWHFIGHLQTNKLKLVLPYVSMIQSIDSLHLLDAVNTWCLANGRCIDILLELHLGAEETKHGLSEDEILAVVAGAAVPPETCATLGNMRGRGPSLAMGGTRGAAPRVSGGTAASGGVRLRGLMGMATHTDDETIIRADFARIQRLFQRIRAEYPALDAFDQLSIGMSGDWPLALDYGATLIRLGTAIFGERG